MCGLEMKFDASHVFPTSNPELALSGFCQRVFDLAVLRGVANEFSIRFVMQRPGISCSSHRIQHMQYAYTGPGVMVQSP